MRRSKRAAVAAALGLAWATTAAATEIPWRPHLLTSRPDGPTAVAAGDFDGDGDLDLMVASDGDGRVRWAENTDGAGAFSNLHTVAVVANPAALALGDLDGDGDLDAVVASAGLPGPLVWLENDGSPDVFAWPTHQIADRAGAVSVALADLDGDGDLDVVAASVFDDGILWHENDGAAVPSFTEHRVTADPDGLGGANGPCDGAAGVIAVDLDGDGDLDLVTACFENDRVAWHENTDGAGSFGPQQVIDSTLDGARHLAAGDFDGDGRLDLVASGQEDGRVVRYLQTAPGVFSSPQLVDQRAGATTLDVADPDRDGDLDLLMADDHGVRWREHAGDLAFRTLDVSVAPTWGPHAAVWADLDGDGDLDVLAVRHAVDHPIWFENRTIHRSAVFPDAPIDLAALDDLDVVAAGDLDGDGDLDLVSTAWLRAPNDPQGFFLLWSENTGDGFAPEERLARIEAPGVDVALGDVDGDGDLDVLLSLESVSASVLDWWENEGDATFVTRHRLAGGRLWPDVELVDLDGDGDLDVVAADWHFFDDVALTWFENLDGAGGFAASQTLWEHAANPESIAVADFDRDGDLDVAVATRNGPIVWLPNLAPGFGPAQTVHIPAAATGAVLLEAADLDADGRPDLVAHSAAGGVEWLRNLGGGAFAGPVALGAFPGGGEPAALEVADLDGDGDLDLAIGDRGAPRLAWLENPGGGAAPFTLHLRELAGGLGVRDLAVADLDGDGDLDLAHGGRSTVRQGWWPNRGGQVRLTATDVAQRWLAGGETYELFRLRAAHLGRPGDAAAALTEVVLLVESGEGAFASPAEIASVFADFGLWLDDGDGVFDPARDTGLATSWQVVGVETRIALTGFALPPTADATLWLTGTTAPSPSLPLRLTERAGRRTFRHAESDPPIRLSEAPETDTRTGWLGDALDAAGCFGPYELEVFGFTVVAGEVVCRAGTDLSAHDAGASGGAGSLVLRAGRSVALGDGFSIADGARLRIEIDPGLLPAEE